jgi:hypothetical protein
MERLRVAGPEKAKEITWRAAGKQLLRTYQEIIESHGQTNSAVVPGQGRLETSKAFFDSIEVWWIRLSSVSLGLPRSYDALGFYSNN